MSKKPLVFIVDDDSAILKLVEYSLQDDRFNIKLYSYGEDCLKELGHKPDLVILDYNFYNDTNSAMNGLSILKEIKTFNPDIPVVMLSSQEDGATVLELMKEGIEDYIVKGKNFTQKLKEVISEILDI